MLEVRRGTCSYDFTWNLSARPYIEPVPSSPIFQSEVSTGSSSTWIFYSTSTASKTAKNQNPGSVVSLEATKKLTVSVAVIECSSVYVSGNARATSQPHDCRATIPQTNDNLSANRRHKRRHIERRHARHSLLSVSPGLPTDQLAGIGERGNPPKPAPQGIHDNSSNNLYH